MDAPLGCTCTSEALASQRSQLTTVLRERRGLFSTQQSALSRPCKHSPQQPIRGYYQLLTSYLQSKPRLVGAAALVQVAWSTLLTERETLPKRKYRLASFPALSDQLIRNRRPTIAASDEKPPEAETERGRKGFSLRTVALVLLFGGVGALVRIIVTTLPPDFLQRWKRLFNDQPENPKRMAEKPLPSIIYDRHGTVIATVVAGGFGGTVDGSNQKAPLQPQEIPSSMWQAVVASEDRRFFEHKGIDPRGLSRALFTLSQSGGGSTITQQLVKNVFLTNERKWSRKLVEMVLALIVERQMTKWDIVHLYLNKIYWGHGVHGIKAAASFYFGKHPSVLTLGECAMLAGIIPAPELLSPYRDPSRGKKPQARALRRMVEAGFIDAATAAEAVKTPLLLADGTEAAKGAGPWRAPYFVSEVLHEVNSKYGSERVLRGGLQIHTTLDLEMQETAEKVVRDGALEYDDERKENAERDIVIAAKRVATAETNWQRNSSAAAIAKAEEEVLQAANARIEGAMVAMDPLSGAVRVLVGGRDYYESPFNRATQALRPPGSTFKPIVYLAAFSEGFEKDHILEDEPYTVGEFTPENYDRKFRGPVTLERALVRSLNVPTVRLCAELGVDKVCRMGKALGIETPLPHELPLALGSCEVTPLQLATVYSTIAAGGVYSRPHIITRIEDPEGRILEQVKPYEGVRRGAVVQGWAVTELRKLLQAVIERGTGQAAHFGRPAAGKTGTTDEHRDVWFAGFTPELSCVVWLGYDDNAPVGGTHPATGASHAAPLWKRFMTRVHEGLPVSKFHDVARDRTRGAREFTRRSRRRQKARMWEDSAHSAQRGAGPTPWREVFDWEKASKQFEEREKMDEWVQARLRHSDAVRARRAGLPEPGDTDDASSSGFAPIVETEAAAGPGVTNEELCLLRPDGDELAEASRLPSWERGGRCRKVPLREKEGWRAGEGAQPKFRSKLRGVEDVKGKDEGVVEKEGEIVRQAGEGESSRPVLLSEDQFAEQDALLMKTSHVPEAPVVTEKKESITRVVPNPLEETLAAKVAARWAQEDVAEKGPGLRTESSSGSRAVTPPTLLPSKSTGERGNGAGWPPQAEMGSLEADEVLDAPIVELEGESEPLVSVGQIEAAAVDGGGRITAADLGGSQLTTEALGEVQAAEGTVATDEVQPGDALQPVSVVESVEESAKGSKRPAGRLRGVLGAVGGKLKFVQSRGQVVGKAEPAVVHGGPEGGALPAVVVFGQDGEVKGGTWENKSSDKVQV